MIIRTIKTFEEHDEIDMILVVCEEWNGKLCGLDKYNVMKVKQIVGQEIQGENHHLMQ